MDKHDKMGKLLARYFTTSEKFTVEDALKAVTKALYTVDPMRLNLSVESSFRAWFWRLALGPAQIIDGLISVCTLTFVSSRLTLNTSRALARARFEKRQQEETPA